MCAFQCRVFAFVCFSERFSRVHDVFVQDDSLMRWSAVIKGPADTPFHTATFHLKIVIPSNYPLYPPTFTFVTNIFHPNIHWRVRFSRLFRGAALHMRCIIISQVHYHHHSFTDGRDLSGHSQGRMESDLGFEQHLFGDSGTAVAPGARQPAQLRRRQVVH